MMLKTRTGGEFYESVIINVGSECKLTQGTERWCRVLAASVVLKIL